jgi:hypothetical protein
VHWDRLATLVDPLVEAELGIMLEVPGPVRLMVIGQLHARLPVPDPIVELHIDVLGILDFDGKSLSIDASLRDSRIAAFSLSGDAALRLRWGDPPSFAFSLGGLHPAFEPPVGFPTVTDITPVHETELDGVTLAWEKQRLVMRRGTEWMRYLRAVSTASEMPRYRTTLQRAGERIIVTVHDTEDSKVEAIASDRASGDELWRSSITNTANVSTLNMSVRTAIESDQLLVRGEGALVGPASKHRHALRALVPTDPAQPAGDQ